MNQFAGLCGDLPADHAPRRRRLLWAYASVLKGDSLPLLSLVLGKPRLDDALDQREGQRLVEWELHRPCGRFEPGEFVLELGENRATRKQAEVIGERGITRRSRRYAQTPGFGS
jgi:hypothetical protein